MAGVQSGVSTSKPKWLLMRSSLRLAWVKNLFPKIRSLFQPNNLNKSLDSKVAKEMAKKIAEDAKMHRKAREI